MPCCSPLLVAVVLVLVLVRVRMSVGDVRIAVQFKKRASMGAACMVEAAMLAFRASGSGSTVPRVVTIGIV